MDADRCPRWKWADTWIVISCLITAGIEASLGIAYLWGPAFLQAWTKSGVGKALYVLPNFGALMRLVSMFWIFTQNARVFPGIAHLVFAALTVLLAAGIAKKNPRAYWIFLAVCFVSVIGQVLAISEVTNWQKLRGLSVGHHFIGLNIAGIVLAVASGWYARRVAIPPALSGRSGGTTDTGVPGRTKLIFATVAALLTYLAVFGFSIQHASGSAKLYEAWRGALMCAALIGVLLLQLTNWTARFAASTAFGAGLLGLLTLGGTGFVDPNMFLVGLAFSIGSGGLKEPAFWALTAFLASCLALTIVALSQIRQRGLSIAAIAVGMLWVAGINPAVSALRKRDSDRYLLAHELAKGGPYLMYRAESCLLQYRAKQNKGFPETLDKIDQALPGCLPAGTAEGQEIGGYRIEYHVTGAQPFAHFSLTALPKVHSRDGTVSFFADDSGVVRTSSVDRTATATDAGVTPAEDFIRIERCIEDFTTRSDKQNKFGRDVNIGYDSDQMRYPATFGAMLQDAECFMKDWRDGDGWKTAAYRYTYRRTLENGRENFVLTGRPIEYGVTGLRSYFVDNRSIIHATSEDREATEQDGWAYRCEMFSLGSPCHDPMPSTRAITERDWPTDDPRCAPTVPSTHAGGLATADKTALFWNSNQDFLDWTGAAEGGSRVYIDVRGKGILAMSGNGEPLWIYPEGENGLVVGDSLYVATELGLISRIKQKGAIAWSLDLRSREVAMQFRDGVLYAHGNEFYAIAEDGQVLWRMKLPGSFTGTMTLSADGKRLYIVDPVTTHAINATNGKRLWSIKNECNHQAENCKVEELANGSIALMEVSLSEFQRKTVLLRLINAKGAPQWQQEYPALVAPFEYVVPRGTNTIIVNANDAMKGLNARGELQWTSQGYWRDLSPSRSNGLFFANAKQVEMLLDASGHVRYAVPSAGLGPEPLGKVQEMSDDLLMISNYHTIWTARLPESASKLKPVGSN